ncbi:MAG: TlpA family protein disulfide reductase [Chlorobiaceae bacterium]|nr:TlpA family protein disulfide reductase [Chlorobiaceae bacterium]
MKTQKMKKFGAAFIALVLSFGLSSNASALDKGEKVPDFSLPGKQGAVKLSDKAGSLIYLDFWASWCGPCRQSFPWMNEMQAKYKAKGLQVVAVNLDARTDDAMKFLAQNHADFTVAFDSKGQTPRVFGVKGMPTSFLIDRNGMVLMQHVGFKHADSEDIEKQIQSALEGK